MAKRTITPEYLEQLEKDSNELKEIKNKTNNQIEQVLINEVTREVKPFKDELSNINVFNATSLNERDTFNCADCGNEVQERQEYCNGCGKGLIWE